MEIPRPQVDHSSTSEMSTSKGKKKSSTSGAATSGRFSFLYECSSHEWRNNPRVVQESPCPTNCLGMKVIPMECSICANKAKILYFNMLNNRFQDIVKILAKNQQNQANQRQQVRKTHSSLLDQRQQVRNFHSSLFDQRQQVRNFHSSLLDQWQQVRNFHSSLLDQRQQVRNGFSSLFHLKIHGNFPPDAQQRTTWEWPFSLP